MEDKLKRQFKQISFNEYTGKIFLVDCDNNSYESNIYGNQVPKFLPNITGFSSYQNRLESGHVDCLDFKYDKRLYRPQTRIFEGYFQFPRPLSQPFFNEKFPLESKKELLTELKSSKRFTLPKTTHLIELKSNEGFPYFTSSLSMIDTLSKDKLISLIDDFIEEFIIRNKYKQNLLVKDNRIKALKKLKRLLLENAGDKLIFNRQLPLPAEDIKEKHLVLSNFMKTKMNSWRGTGKVQSLNKSGDELISNILPNAPQSQRNKKSIEENLTFLTNDDGVYNEKDSAQIKKRSSIERYYSQEKKLLTGFKPVVIKDKGMFSIMQKSRNMKTPGEFYREDLKLTAKVNPMAIKREEEKNAFDRKVLEKKRQMKLIYEKIKF